MLDKSISIYALILAIGSIQGIFLVLNLMGSGLRKNKANWMLAFFIFLFAYDLFIQFITELNLIHYVPQLLIFDHVVNLLYGPLLYLYIQIVTGRTAPFKKHFIPAIIAVFSSIYFVASYSTEQLQEFIVADVIDDTLFLSLIDIVAVIAGIVSILVYLFLGISTIIKHQKLVADNFSYRENLDLQWLKYIISFVGIISLLYLFNIASSIYTLQVNEFGEKLLFITLTTTIFILGFKGLKQPQVFTIDFTNNQNETDNVIDDIVSQPSTSYLNSSLDSDDSKLINEELKSIINENKCFLNPKLTLNELADISGFKTHNISQAINQNDNINFFGFINQYRVEHAKQLLSENIDTTPNILNIAMDSGFNSKSSFYTAFKKLTHMTPIQYREQLIKDKTE